MQSKSPSPEDNQAEIYIHPFTNATLRDHLSKKMLPLEYGGESGPIETIIKFWEQKLIDYRDYFLQDAEFRTNEALRPPEYRHFHADFLAATSSY